MMSTWPWWGVLLRDLLLVVSGAGVALFTQWLIHWATSKRETESERRERVRARAEFQQENLVAAQVAAEEFFHSLIAFTAARNGIDAPGRVDVDMADAHLRLRLALARLEDQELVVKVDTWRGKYFGVMTEAQKNLEWPDAQTMAFFRERLVDISQQLGAQARDALSDDHLRRMLP